MNSRLGRCRAVKGVVVVSPSREAVHLQREGHESRSLSGEKHFNMEGRAAILAPTFVARTYQSILRAQSLPILGIRMRVPDVARDSHKNRLYALAVRVRRIPAQAVPIPSIQDLLAKVLANLLLLRLLVLGVHVVEESCDRPRVDCEVIERPGVV